MNEDLDTAWFYVNEKNCDTLVNLAFGLNKTWHLMLWIFTFFMVCHEEKGEVGDRGFLQFVFLTVASWIR